MIFQNTDHLETVELIDSQCSDVSQPPNTWAPERNVNLPKSALNEDQKVQLNTLSTKYSNLFANYSYDLGRTHSSSHEISIENAAPVKQRPNCVSRVNKPKIQQHLQEMLQHDINRPSQCPWSSPVIIIGKKMVVVTLLWITVSSIPSLRKMPILSVGLMTLWTA